MNQASAEAAGVVERVGSLGEQAHGAGRLGRAGAVGRRLSPDLFV
jgi:hypothetical protein